MANYTINNTVLSFNNIYYVDPVNGVDSTARSGSTSAPYKTVNWTVNNKCASSGDAIVALAGTHNVTTTSGSYGLGGLYDAGKSISFIGLPGKTIFLCDGTKHSSRDHHAVCTYGTSTKIYDIIFDVKFNNRGTNYSASFFGRDSVEPHADIYNCVFISDHTSISAMIYNNGSGLGIRCYNCVFKVNVDFTGSYSGASYVWLTNCVSNKSFYPDVNRTTCLSPVTLNSKYAITSAGWQNSGTGNDLDGSVADLGVYGWTYAWKLYKVLIADGTKLYNYSSGSWVHVGDTPVTQTMMQTYGMDSPPSMSVIRQLNNPELVVWAESTDTRTVSITIPDKEVYYAVSMDNTTWYTYINGDWNICTDVYKYGMSKSEIESLSYTIWNEIFIPGQLYFKVALKSNNNGVSPYLDQINVNLPETFNVGAYYVMTNLNQLDLTDWKRINKVTMNQETPIGTDIRYAVSMDNKNNWIVYENGWKPIELLNIHTDGMTKAQIESLTWIEWETVVINNQQNILDLVACLINTEITSAPKIDSVVFDYTRVDLILDTEEIEVPVPEVGYRNVWTSGIYVLKLAEGLAFDSTSTDYDFYTTPDRIYIKSLDAGSYIGGRVSNVFAVEVINGYDSQDFEVILNAMTSDGQLGEPHTGYCLLPDYTDDEGKTKIELGKVYAEDFETVSEYPLVFNLAAQEKKVIYIRINPTIYSTVGNRSLKIQLTGRPL